MGRETCLLGRWLLAPWFPEVGFYLVWQAALLGLAAAVVIAATLPPAKPANEAVRPAGRPV
jgi:hypothetical protein